MRDFYKLFLIFEKGNTSYTYEKLYNIKKMALISVEAEVKDKKQEEQLTILDKAKTSPLLKAPINVPRYADPSYYFHLFKNKLTNYSPIDKINHLEKSIKKTSN
jgi:hypothetical protein